METTNLNKSIRQIFQSNYVVPLYQRNYAWAEAEIQQLIQDIYESYKKDANGLYFIGTLVVLKRKNGDFEVIDGQQRLTTLSLIAKKLKPSLQTSKLHFDSRPEVESFLNTYYQRGEVATTTTNHLVSHFDEAIEYIEMADLEANPNKTYHLIDFLNDTDISDFKNYFFNNVQIVKVEIPPDTDVAHYFEVMNSRGEQLEEHEIVKARLLDKIKDDKEASITFSKIWDACSQMNKPIQGLFKQEDRKRFFGDNYDTFKFDSQENLENNERKEEEEVYVNTINSILLNSFIIKEDDYSAEVDKEKDFEAIIDFPNFLMHVLKLYFNGEEDLDIPLNADELLKKFDDLKEAINPLEFIENLLFYRIVFDRFIVKIEEDENSEDNTKWVLYKPKCYYYEKDKSYRLIYENSFKSRQESIIKCLSMLQVTFRTRKYKNYLQEILSWFSKTNDLEIQEQIYLDKLHGLLLDTYNRNTAFDGLIKEMPYCEGTSTPHFLLNFIDYLYWTENKSIFKFEFKYRNSVEHHLPQSRRNEDNKDVMDCLGNLCLVSKSGNSKMNDKSPIGKADIKGKYYKDTLPAKQLTMYNITNEKGKWGVREILDHYNDVIDLLDRRDKILETYD